MLQFLFARMLEAEDFTALLVDAGKDVADRTVLPGGVHSLKNEEQRIGVGRIEQALQSAQFPGVRREKLLVILCRLVERLNAGCPFLELDLLPGWNAEVFEVDLHTECSLWEKVSPGKVGLQGHTVLAVLSCACLFHRGVVFAAPCSPVAVGAMIKRLLSRLDVRLLTSPNLQSRLLDGTCERKRQRPRQPGFEYGIHGIQAGRGQFSRLAA